MHQVEVEIVGLQLLQGLLQGRLDVFRRMAVVPEFGRDPQLFAADNSFCAGSIHGPADFRLVAVDERAINMPVTAFERFLNRRIDFSRAGFPGAQTQYRHLIGVREFEVFQ